MSSYEGGSSDHAAARANRCDILRRKRSQDPQQSDSQNVLCTERTCIEKSGGIGQTSTSANTRFYRAQVLREKRANSSAHRRSGINITEETQIIHELQSSLNCEDTRLAQDVFNATPNISLNLMTNKSKVFGRASSSGAANELTLYEDLGDPHCSCVYCGAQMWYNERLRKDVNEYVPRFGMCCLQGKIKLPVVAEPPTLLKSLLDGSHPDSKHFQAHIRTYNMMFAFTSMGGKIDREINDGRGPYVYRMGGQNIHMIGSILPMEGASPKFAQLYIYDTSNEVSNRVSAIRGDNGESPPIKLNILESLQTMLDDHNCLVQTFRKARDFINSHEGECINIKLIHQRGPNRRQYNLPTNQNEIAALIVGDIGSTEQGRDIIVQYRTGLLKRIHETHPDFLPLQYPLLFPHGVGGYEEKIPHVRERFGNQGKNTYVSMREYFAYLIQDRMDNWSVILHGEKLFQQFIVDAYMMMESWRLAYIRNHQKQLRAELYRGLTDAVLQGETEAAARGKRIILPSSFTGGARYIFNNYQDAMAICGWAGYPDLFITFTCNPGWPEITRYIQDFDTKVEHIPHILDRIFKMKLDLLMKDIKRGDLFGPVKAALYTIEFQKRGLPHAHIVIFLATDKKIITASDVDQVICAEIPDKDVDPELYQTVSDFMIHGPCGSANPKSPCMSKGTCSKHYPKEFNSTTIIHEDGYPRYKRPNNGRHIIKNGIPLDNRSVVPYNPYLLLKYRAHINVERCKEGDSIKYLFKYVTKGHDRATAAFYSQSSSNNSDMVHDEIKMYCDVRYLSPCEAAWRILGFDINYRTPAVERLSFHLPGQQSILYEEHEDLNNVVNRNTGKLTQFEAWMKANDDFESARSLTYSEFPTKFVYKEDTQMWDLRKSGFAIGRLYYVPPGAGEVFYLRLLLASIKGLKSYRDIRTVDGVHYATFRDACYAKGLLEDDKEYIDAISEASRWATPEYLRRLFGTLLFCNCMSRPEIVWAQTWKLMAQDILYRLQHLTNNSGFSLNEKELHDHTLLELEEALHANGRSLCDFPTMPCPSMPTRLSLGNKLLIAEMNYNLETLSHDLHCLLPRLTSEQRSIYDTIIDAVNKSIGGMYFIYGYGGTGKTYLWRTLSTSLRVNHKIVLTVASSGIASLLLPNGKTAHSQFAIPLTITEDSVCNIKQGTQLAELLSQTSLIIWDEAPMANKFCFEALDKSLRDIMKRTDSCALSKPFGGKVIVLEGDFRQILAVIPRGRREDIVFASINASYLWKECKIFTLTKNMRLSSCASSFDNDALTEFANWILSIGDGTIPTVSDTDDLIIIPNDFLLMPNDDPLKCIIQSTYPELLHHLHDKEYFSERAILTATLSVVDEVNNRMLEMLPGEEMVYLSADSVSKQDVNVSSITDIHSVEFLNKITMSGLPNHQLKLKVGAPIMLMRNIDKFMGLCNGTRLIVTRLEKHVIGCEILAGPHSNKQVLIPRMTITPSDSSYPFKLCRRQFPVVLSFAMTINKSQGQSLLSVGLFLPRPVFTHGQLYVAVSRVRRKEGLKILILDSDGQPTNKTSNVVYKEVFCNL